MSDFSLNRDVVRRAQVAINASGYTPALVVDGGWGQKTAAGVVWARRKFGLAAVAVGGLDEALVAKLGLGAVAPKGASPGVVPTGDFANLVTFAQKFSQPLTQGSGIAPGFQAT